MAISLKIAIHVLLILMIVPKTVLINNKPFNSNISFHSNNGHMNCIGDIKGTQPAHVAAYYDRLDCLKLLLKKGRVKCSDTDNKGRNALHKVRRGHFHYNNVPGMYFAFI